ncbi:MAG: hypothetical protein KGI27_06025 [Thaumarchaeota archaeon]|nr:hypothetical protein [Nitrososphaerota archaeon]
MYFVRRIRKTKRLARKSSFIVSLPRKLERKVASYNTEISKRLSNFTRFRCFYKDTENPKCFLVTVWDDELPPNSPQDKDGTTTIQRSGRTSRYVLIPRKVCNKFGWAVGTELVIGIDFQLDEYVQGSIYKDGKCFLPANTPNQEVHVCVIKFQTYKDMKEIYKKNLAKRKEELAREESEAYWKNRDNPRAYDFAIKRVREEIRNLHRHVWNKLESMNLVAVPYTDFVKLRADMEREKKRKKREYLKKRYGDRSTWNYRKNQVRYGIDYDVKREAMLDDPDSYLEAAADDPETYSWLKPQKNHDSWSNDEDESDY